MRSSQIESLSKRKEKEKEREEEERREKELQLGLTFMFLSAAFALTSVAAYASGDRSCGRTLMNLSTASAVFGAVKIVG